MVEKSWRLQSKLRRNLVSVTSPVILRKSTSLRFSIKWNFYELNKTNWLTCFTGHKFMWDMCVIPQVLFYFFSKYACSCYYQVQKPFVLSFFWTWQLYCYSSSCVAQTGLELCLADKPGNQGSPASASTGLGLQVWAHHSFLNIIRNEKETSNRLVCGRMWSDELEGQWIWNALC